MIIFDSNVWLGRLNEDDTLHEKAVISFQTEEMIGVPYCIASEVATLLTIRRTKEEADDFLQFVVNNSQTVMLDDEYASEILFFVGHNEKISFIDSSLLHLTKKYNCKLVTFDKQLARLSKKDFGKVVKLSE